MEGPKSALNSFLTKFNEVLTFLDENTSVTKIADNQYTRGGLSDDTIFSDLRGQLFTSFLAQYTNSGNYKSLNEIGLSFDENLNASVSDTTKLEDALNNNLDSVKSLLDMVMGAVDTQLGRFTGTSGYIRNAIQGFDSQIFQIGIDTKDMNVRLDTKQASLVAQYAEMQSQLLSLQYMQQTWSSLYGGMSRSY
jgi:flagellar hook-associated protein 2